MAKTLSKFNAMYPDVPQYTDNNHWYSLQNVDPLYYLRNNSQEKDTSCLTTSASVATESTTIEGNIVQIINSNNVLYDVFILTDQAHVYGYTSGTLTNFGYPLSTSVAIKGTIAVGNNGTLTYTDASHGNLYTISIASTIVGQGTTWTTRIPGDFATVAMPSITPFLNFVAVTNSNGTNMSKVSLYSSANPYTSTAVYTLNLGSGHSILKIENYQNKYLAIVDVFSSNNATIDRYTPGKTGKAYLSLWNGSVVTSGTSVAALPQQSIPLPAQFVDMKVSDGVLYLLLQENSLQYAVYHYNGRSVVRDFALQIDNPQFPNALFEYPAGIGINLATKGAYIITKNGNDEYRYMTFNTVSNDICYIPAPYGRFYGGTSSIKIQDSQVNILSQTDFTAVSQWIPMSTKLTSVDVMYDSAPTTSGTIGVTLDAWSEDQNDGITTQTLTTIDATNHDTSIKTTLDAKGLTGSMVRVTVTGHGTSTWRPIVRLIQLNEDTQK